MSAAKPTRRRSASPAQRHQASQGAGFQTQKGTPLTEAERHAHALSQRRAFYAAVGVVLFSAAFIVLVLALNQLPWR